MNKKIIVSFSITIFLLLLFGAVSISKMVELSDLTQKLYNYPYAVTNSTKTIEARIISIHRYMKDIILSQNSEELKQTIKHLQEDEIAIYRAFDVIFERYLGNSDDIQKSYNLFVSWKPIRDEVIYLKKLGKVDEAAKIIKGVGREHIKELNFYVNKMVLYAQKRAESLKNEALKSRNYALLFTSIILISLVAITVLIVVLLVQNITKTNKRLKEHLYLVNQNIMSVRTDSSCRILNASNAFLQHFDLSMNEILENNGDFLFSDISDELRAHILKVIQNGDEYQGEIYKINKDGSQSWYFIHITPSLDENFIITGFTIIIHDISDRKELENLSKIDALTNIYNRRYFNLKFLELVRDIKNKNKKLVFMMVDIDFFKQYNDFYGHKNGDIALKKVAQVLKRSIKRSNDMVFRLGGEEFGLLFSVSNDEDAIELGERIRANVESLEIEHYMNKASNYMTISAGVIVIDKENNFDIEELYDLCDKALYRAKHLGRNRVILAE